MRGSGRVKLLVDLDSVSVTVSHEDLPFAIHVYRYGTVETLFDRDILGR